MTKLEIQNLALDYQLQRSSPSLAVLRDITCTVEPGEFVAIVGPSGCGKSSLLNLIAGLQPPTQGTIRLDSQPVQGPGRDRAIVFEAPALLPWRTVQDNVAYGLELHGYPRREIPLRAQRFMDLVGLTGFEESYPRELASGIQQRVNLARALAVDPLLILMDEPLAAADAQTREILQIELQHIWLETGHSVLYATHQIDEALFLADRVFVLSPRPATIQQIIQVPFPRPRTTSLKHQTAFIKLAHQIWQLLHNYQALPFAR